jgi:membrane-associated protein
MDTLATILSWLLLYKYAALFLVVYTGSVLLPLPINAALLAVGAFSGEHFFNFWLSLAIAIAANCAGDLTAYGIARHWGERVIRLLRLDRLKFFGYLAEELRHNAAITIFLTRQAGYLSNISNFLAGMVEVPFLTFFSFDLIGNLVEPPIAIGVGYMVGNYWSSFLGVFTTATAAVAIVVVMFVLMQISRRIAKRYEAARDN